MILNQFETWARTAPAGGRADGISALARAFLYSHLDEAQRSEAVRVMTAFLDDPSSRVRRALAEALGSAAEAPHHLVLALADDCAPISTIVLSRSPVLGDAELIDCAATAEPAAQAAIAGRPALSAPVAAALAEIAGPEALIVLAGNRAAPLQTFAIRRMVERHGENAALRAALLARPDLPSSVRLDLVAATADALAAFVSDRNWLSGERLKRVTSEAGDRAAVLIAANDGGSRAELVSHLRRSGRLTASFAFRAILSGKIELFKAILVELSGMPAFRVDGLARQSETTGFATLYRRCGLPDDLLPAFRIALQAAREADWSKAQGAGLSRAAIERVVTACTAINSGELDKLMVLLRRFEAEAARDEARQSAVTAAPLTLRDEIFARDEPLILSDFAAMDREPIVERGRPARPVARFTIDMAAIEAELCAA